MRVHWIASYVRKDGGSYSYRLCEAITLLKSAVFFLMTAQVLRFATISV
jgi:hypothetical protein